MANRQALDNGGWFDIDSATATIEEGSRFNGNNHISLATGSQWDHQSLYVTHKGRFILYSWSQWQGSNATWEQITVGEAARWLVLNQRDGDDLPEAAAKLVKDEYEATEV